MADYRDFRRAKQEMAAEDEYREEMRYFAEDLFGEPSPEPEPHKYDPNKTDDMQNFMLGLFAGASVGQAGTQAEIDAFEEQQAQLAEQELERDIEAGLYDGHPFAQMTPAQRQEQYRRDAIDRKQARWERDHEVQQRAKRRQAERQGRDKAGRFSS